MTQDRSQRTGASMTGEGSGGGVGPLTDPAGLAQLLRYDAQRGFAGVDPSLTPGFAGRKRDGQRAQEDDAALIRRAQERLHAHALRPEGARRALILVLQGRDAAGKGGVVRHLSGAVGPHGLETTAFGVPTQDEAAHHFLWRVQRRVPAWGRIAVFDRSHYEDILAVRMHDLAPREVWESRYGTISDFEAGLTVNGIDVVKVMLTVSQDEQADRLRERITDPAKAWKHSASDLADRLRWHEYADAFEDVLIRTDKDSAPWYVVPSDRKWYARWAVGRILLHHLDAMGLNFPEADFDRDAAEAELDATTAAITRR